MIIGISGSHGTGKTSILHELHNLGYHINDSQLSRNVQKRLGWKTLDNVRKVFTNVTILQDAILKEMQYRDSVLDSNKLTFVERTPADLWAYVVNWYAEYGYVVGEDDWSKTYMNKLFNMMHSYTAVIVIPIDKNITFENDPNRADLKSRQLISDVVDNFLFNSNIRAIKLKSSSISDRIEEISRYINRIGFKK